MSGTRVNPKKRTVRVVKNRKSYTLKQRGRDFKRVRVSVCLEPLPIRSQFHRVTQLAPLLYRNSYPPILVSRPLCLSNSDKCQFRGGFLPMPMPLLYPPLNSPPLLAFFWTRVVSTHLSISSSSRPLGPLSLSLSTSLLFSCTGGI